MGWEFDDVGSFGSEKSADDFIKRNKLDPRDVRVRHKGEEVEVEVRRSTIDGRDLKDSGEGRREGW